MRHFISLYHSNQITGQSNTSFNKSLCDVSKEMRSSLKLLASVSGNQPSKLRKPTVSFDHFIQRQRVLGFWREIVRALNKIPPSSTKDELRSYARYEFERQRHVTDLQHIRYLVSTGKSEFSTMRRYIDELAAR